MFFEFLNKPRKKFGGAYQSVIPTLKNCQKVQLVINFHDVATHIFQKKHKVQFFHLCLTQKPSNCTKMRV